MKTSKRSLIASIAVLCVCALSLSTATFAWFTAVNQTQVTELNMKVVEQSDLKIAIDPEAIEAGNLESSMWQTNFTGAQLHTLGQEDKQDFTQDAIAAAYNDGGSLVVPADNDAIKEDGSYDGAWTGATKKVDYVKFTVYFRATTKDQIVKFSGGGFTIEGAKQKLMPALTLDYGNLTDDAKVATGTTTVSDAQIAVCSTEVDGYFVGQADFYVYVDGENPVTINQNAGVNFKLGNITFTAPEA